MRHLKKVAISVAFCIVIVATYFIFLHHPQNQQVSHPVTLVTVSPLRYYRKPQTVIAYGITLSPQSVAIIAQAAGIISSIHFTGGKKIQSGQILLTLKTNDIDNQTQKLKAQMLSSKNTYERYAQMEKQLPGSVAKIRIMQANNQYQQDLSTYNEAKTIAIIQSPVAGIISDTNVTRGSYVTSGETIATVTVPSSLQVRYQLPSRFGNEIKIGQSLRFYPDHSSHSYQGVVTYIAPFLNNDDYSLTIKANLTNTGTLKYSEFGKVEQVINPHYKMLAIPQGLAQTDSIGFFVYTVVNHKIVKQYFKPGRITQDGLIQVKSGLIENTNIISSDPSTLSVGETVQVAH